MLLSLAMLAGLYFTLIIGQPQPKEKEETPAQPALTASPAVNIDREEMLGELIAAFPAPVMSFMSGSGMTFVRGTAADTAWKGQFGRVATLYWQTADGEPLILQSIYPAEALEIMGKGNYLFSGTAGPTLFGRGLYVLTVPLSLAARLTEISRSIQLFAVEKSAD